MGKPNKLTVQQIKLKQMESVYQRINAIYNQRHYVTSNLADRLAALWLRGYSAGVFDYALGLLSAGNLALRPLDYALAEGIVLCLEKEAAAKVQ